MYVFFQLPASSSFTGVLTIREGAKPICLALPVCCQKFFVYHSRPVVYLNKVPKSGYGLLSPMDLVKTTALLVDDLNSSDFSLMATVSKLRHRICEF